MPEHFGVTVRAGKKGLKLSRDKYALINNKNSFKLKFSSVDYTDETFSCYTDEWCKKHQEDCLKNFDLHMEFFSLLDKDDFSEQIFRFVKKNDEFEEVYDISGLDGVSGYYMMVLDEYCQVYIGTSTDLKKRIRQHWSTSKYFDRLLFPMGAVDTSIMAIDSFRALDTTRIFIFKTNDIYEYEADYINGISPCYLCNRLDGGRVTGGYLQAIGMIKNRKLQSD